MKHFNMCVFRALGEEGVRYGVSLGGMNAHAFYSG